MTLNPKQMLFCVMEYVQTLSFKTAQRTLTKNYDKTKSNDKQISSLYQDVMMWRAVYAVS